MLARSVRRCLPVARNGVLNTQKNYLNNVAAKQSQLRGVAIPATDFDHGQKFDKVADAMPSSQKLHRTKTMDPNSELRDHPPAPGVLRKTQSGIHTSGGAMKLARDSAPSAFALLGLIFGVPVAVGMVTNERGTWNSYYEQNPVLTRQNQIKQEFGKGGGGWGEGAGGVGYNQRRAEYGFTDKHRTRDLPPELQKVNDSLPKFQQEAPSHTH